MAGLTSGELFVVAFVTVAVVSAPWWLRLGQWIAELVSGERKKLRDDAAEPTRRSDE